MGDTIDSFFASLAAQDRVPLLRYVSDTLRVDVVSGSSVAHWFVDVRDGAVEVTRSDAPASAVMRTDGPTLDALVTGRANTMAAVLRGAVEVEGNLGLIVLLQRLFPSPPQRAAGPHPTAGGGRS
jgi:hypothetical protein